MPSKTNIDDEQFNSFVRRELEILCSVRINGIERDGRTQILTKRANYIERCFAIFLFQTIVYCNTFSF